MKKNFGENIQSVQVDPISGEYYVTIPEWMINELSWYEDTEVEFNLDGNEIVISEHGID
jgi:hypothetical protein